tara:strand:+ start:4445 stop:4885 length:441 start_codon:yes stop_codon:yes gene_type:complete
MKMLCDRVKELESHKEEFKAELGASATVHERLRILEKEIFEDANAYEDACEKHMGKPVKEKRRTDPNPKDDNYEYPQYDLDPLELNCLQVALDHLVEHLNDLPHKEDENGVRNMENEDEIEARLSCTKTLINFIKRCENEHGTLTF